MTQSIGCQSSREVHMQHSCWMCVNIRWSEENLSSIWSIDLRSFGYCYSLESEWHRGTAMETKRFKELSCAESGCDLQSILSQDDFTTKSDVGNYWQKRTSFSPVSGISNLSSLVDTASVRTEKRRRRRMDKTKQQWKVPRSPDDTLSISKKANLLDRRTIYSEKQKQLFQTLETERVVFPPLENSLRMMASKPDANLAREKAMVMEDYQNSHRSQVHAMRSLYPTASVKIVECPSDDDDDMNSVASSSEHTCHYINNVHHRGHPQRGQFCDVMNRKYCTDCNEKKKRERVTKSQKSYFPSLKKRDKIPPEVIAKKVKRIVINLNVWRLLCSFCFCCVLANLGYIIYYRLSFHIFSRFSYSTFIDQLYIVFCYGI